MESPDQVKHSQVHRIKLSIADWYIKVKYPSKPKENGDFVLIVEMYSDKV
jgi:hypothetical protein